MDGRFRQRLLLLNVLKDYHFHTLKLDMAFLHPFTKESRTILTAIVRMAKELGVHTLAEGWRPGNRLSFSGISAVKNSRLLFRQALAGCRMPALLP